MKEYHLRPAGDAPRSRIDYARELNPQQLDVVLAGDGPLLVIAGAGSGKTRTLTYRVARLLELGVPSAQILLLTFTNKAAREMIRRVELITGGDHRITGGTFHHVGNLILRRYANLVGRHPNFTILDREDAKDLMNDVAAQVMKRDKRAPKGDVLLEIYSYAQNTEAGYERILSDRHPVFYEMHGEMIRCFHLYATRKQELNLVDFDDLLTLWRDLVTKHAEVRDRLRAQWRYILVDEYQDTNRLQSQIVETIAGENGNLMVVGDDAQSIYSFRGADFGNIIDFPDRFPSCRIFKLETNYRSVPEVLELANSSIAHNRRQFPKVLHAARPSGGKPELVTCGEVQEQARFVAQRMLDLQDEGIDLGEVAVLYRAHWHSMELQMELTRLGIPFQVRSGLRFFEQAHIKDVAAYMKIVHNPKDELSWKRILPLYPRVGKATAAKIFDSVQRLEDPLSQLSSVKNMPKALVDVFARIRDVNAPGKMIRSVVDGGYETYLTTTYPNFKLRLEDLTRLADYSMRFEDVPAFLSELALSNNVAGQAAVEDRDDEDAVVLSTIHQAKGLEWRAVFVIWLADGKLPDGRGLREEGGEEEERRLFYVAVTRAKDRLFLVYPIIADERNMLGVIQRPSRFVQELDKSTYEETRIAYHPY